MPTVIDSLVVELGLDASKFNQQQLKALENAKQLEDQQVKAAKNIEYGFDRSNTAVEAFKSTSLSAFAVITGSAGLVQFAAQAVHAGAAVGRLSRNTGIAVETISKFQAVAEVFGGSAEGVASSFIEMTDALQGWKIGDVRQVIADYRALGGAGGTIIDINKSVSETTLDIAKNLRALHDKDPAMGGYWQRRLGIDPGLYDAMIQKGEKFNETLAKMQGLTQAEADAAGKLERRWNTFTKNATRSAQGFVLDMVDAKSMFNPFQNGSDAKDWEMIKGWFSSVFGSEAKASTSTAPAVASAEGRSNPAWRNAIAAIESRGSGGYAAIGPVTRSGDRAYGKYQIMGNNIGEWSQAATGKKMSIEEFMASPDAQDKIFDHRFGQYVKQFGNPQDAASAWLTGKPLSGGANRRDINGTSGSEYVRRFNAEGGGSSSTTTTEININGPITVQPPAGANADKFATDFAAALKRQGETFLANNGAQ